MKNSWKLQRLFNARHTIKLKYYVKKKNQTFFLVANDYRHVIAFLTTVEDSFPVNIAEILFFFSKFATMTINFL